MTAQEYSSDLLLQLSFVEFMDLYSGRELIVSPSQLFDAVGYYVENHPTSLKKRNPLPKMMTAFADKDLPVDELIKLQNSIVTSQAKDYLQDPALIKKDPETHGILYAMTWSLGMLIVEKKRPYRSPVGIKIRAED